jgi:hypothetical protein
MFNCRKEFLELALRYARLRVWSESCAALVDWLKLIRGFGDNVRSCGPRGRAGTEWTQSFLPDEQLLRIKSTRVDRFVVGLFASQALQPQKTRGGRNVCMMQGANDCNPLLTIFEVA